MSLIFPYRSLPTTISIPTLENRWERPRPLITVSIMNVSRTRVVQALLDTGADGTVFPEIVAQDLGLDLSQAETMQARGIIGPPTQLWVARVQLRLATSINQVEWSAKVCFTNAPLRTPLLGFAGCLQYFTATFFGDREEVELTPNALLPLP